MKLDIKAFGLAFGILWGLAMFIGTWWIIMSSGVQEGVPLMGKFYLGYRITPLGSVVGLIWGFFDGLISGVIFAWLYNRLAR